MNSLAVKKPAFIAGFPLPNVPFSYRSRYWLEAGRPWTLWLWRAKARPGQVNHYLDIDLSTRLRLSFEGKDTAKLYRKNETRDPIEWQAQDERRKELLAKKYLSTDESDTIRTKREMAAGIKEAAKARPAGSTKLTPDEKAQILQLKADIKAIQDLHGLSAADSREIAELNKFLFRQIETIQLNENAQSLIGFAFSITAIDYGTGTVQFVLDIGRNAWVFEDKYLTVRHRFGWLWGTTPSERDQGFDVNERMTISGSGGALVWRFSYVKTNSDTLVSAPMDLGRAIELSGNPVNGLWSRNLPPGNDIAFSVREYLPSQTGAINTPPQYQLVIEFKTDGKFLPLLFRAQMQIMATPRAANVLVWDSATTPGAVVNVIPHQDGKRKLFQVTIMRKDGFPTLGLPRNRARTRCGFAYR